MGCQHVCWVESSPAEISVPSDRNRAAWLPTRTNLQYEESINETAVGRLAWRCLCERVKIGQTGTNDTLRRTQHGGITRRTTEHSQKTKLMVSAAAIMKVSLSR